MINQVLFPFVFMSSLSICSAAMYSHLRPSPLRKRKPCFRDPAPFAAFELPTLAAFLTSPTTYILSLLHRMLLLSLKPRNCLLQRSFTSAAKSCASRRRLLLRPRRPLLPCLRRFRRRRAAAACPRAALLQRYRLLPLNSLLQRRAAACFCDLRRHAARCCIIWRHAASRC